MFHAIVPVKSLGLAKSRLSALLEPHERRMLALAMLEDVLRTLRATPQVSTTWVVTRDPFVADISAQHGAQAYYDSAETLNGALTQAANSSIAAGAQQLIVMHADLPLVQPADITALTDSLVSGSAIGLAPARDGGTNALACTVPVSLPFHFGNASLARHLAEARERNVDVQLVRTRNLERDIDRPDDLIWLVEQPGDSAAQHTLRWLGILERVACV